jgi:arginase
MSVIQVPYHLDEYLPDLDVLLPAGAVITADLPAGDVWSRLSVLYADLAAVVAGEAGRGRLVVVSGDCMTALGTMSGLQRAGVEAGIVWLEAHGDVQALETTASGYFGWSAAAAAGGLPARADRRPAGLRVVSERQVTLAGARDLDPPEAAYLAGAQIRGSQVEELDAAGLPGRALYVHLDLEVIDPGQLPGLRFPAPGGPGLERVIGALTMVLATGRAAAVGNACTWYPGHSAAMKISHLLGAARA